VNLDQAAIDDKEFIAFVAGGGNQLALRVMFYINENLPMAISFAFCKEVQKPKKSPGSILTHLSKTYAGSVAFAAITQFWCPKLSDSFRKSSRVSMENFSG